MAGPIIREESDTQLLVWCSGVIHERFALSKDSKIQVGDLHGSAALYKVSEVVQHVNQVRRMDGHLCRTGILWRAQIDYEATKSVHQHPIATLYTSKSHDQTANQPTLCIYHTSSPTIHKTPLRMSSHHPYKSLSRPSIHLPSPAHIALSRQYRIAGAAQ